MTVTIQPLAEFVREIGGDRVSAHVLVPRGANPHAYEPTTAQLRALSRSALYVAAGSQLEFETIWLDRLLAMNPSMKLCESAEGIELLSWSEEGAHHHGDHAASRRDPHVWLSPVNAMLMVRNIERVLVEIDSSARVDYNQRAKRFVEQLQALDRRLKKRLEPLTQRTFMVYHPDWAYFAKEYRLIQVSIESEGKEPGAKMLVKLIKRAKTEGVRVIFTSPQISARAANVIAREIGGRVELADPLAEHYIDNLDKMAELIAEASG